MKKNLPSAKAHDAVTMAAPTRREHPTATVVSGGTVVASSRAAIEANGHAGAAKRLTETKVHPSMAANTNRGFGVRKGVEPAAPLVANPATSSKPTRAPAVHTGATGRRSAGADTPGESSGVGFHNSAEGDKILAEGFARSNNKLPREVHHSTVTPQAVIAEVEKTIV